MQSLCDDARKNLSRARSKQRLFEMGVAIRFHERELGRIHRTDLLAGSALVVFTCNGEPCQDIVGMIVQRKDFSEVQGG